MSVIVIITILICFLFAFINGFHDGCNVIATIIASRSINPGKALWIACIAEFMGPMLLGLSVAATIGKGVVDFEILKTINLQDSVCVFLSAVLGAIVWNLLTWWLRLPSSSSHALIGGLLGAGLVVLGVRGINWNAFLYKVLLVMFTSPIIGFLAGYICLKIVVAFTAHKHPRTNNYLKKIQIVSMFALGMSHGSNDAQKTMGIISTVLLLTGVTQSFYVPVWVQVLSAAMMSLGLAAGGWRLIKTVGAGIFNVKPIHSFSSQLASTSTIITASLIGGPVSSTQIVNSSVMGVGTAERMNAVRWEMVKNILVSWGCTIPASAVMAAAVFYITKIFINFCKF